MLSYFDHMAANYRERSATMPWAWLRRFEERAVLEACLPLNSRARVLDLGAGAGYYTESLHKLGYKNLTAVDISGEMLAQIKCPGCATVRADIQQYRSEEPFDLIVCAGAIEFLDQPQKMFANVAAMLKPGGSFVLLSPEQCAAGRLYRLFHRRHGVAANLFTEDQLVEKGLAAGLSYLGSTRCGLFSRVSCFAQVPGR